MWLVPLAAFIAGPLLRGFLASYRLVSVAGGEHLDRLLETREPVIFTCWHNRQVVCGGAIYRRLVRRGYPLVGLVSRSRDGELLARMCRSMGIDFIRGSTSRGAVASSLKLHRALTRKRRSIAVAPDGPRGPVYKAQRGVVTLARTAAAPIVPMAYAARSAWRLKSWDRLILPKPFSKVALVVGKPYRVSPNLEHEADETARLERTLEALVEQAQTALEAAR